MTFDFDEFGASGGHQLRGWGERLFLLFFFYSANEACLPGPGAKRGLKPKQAARPIHLSTPGS